MCAQDAIYSNFLPVDVELSAGWLALREFESMSPKVIDFMKSLICARRYVAVVRSCSYERLALTCSTSGMSIFASCASLGDFLAVA